MKTYIVATDKDHDGRTYILQARNIKEVAKRFRKFTNKKGGSYIFSITSLSKDEIFSGVMTNTDIERLEY